MLPYWGFRVSCLGLEIPIARTRFEEDREGREKRDEKSCCSVVRVKGRDGSRQMRGSLGWVGFFLFPKCRRLCPTLNFGFASYAIWGEVLTFCEKIGVVTSDNPRVNLDNEFRRRIINITVVLKWSILNIEFAVARTLDNGKEFWGEGIGVLEGYLALWKIFVLPKICY